MSRRFPRIFDGNLRCRLMFPVSVCLGIEKRDASPKMSSLSTYLSSRAKSRDPVAFPSVASRDSSTTLRSARNDCRNMNERYIKWYTPWLSREFEMLVFGDKRGLPLVLFPTSGARYYENKDFGLVGAIASYVDNGKVTVYCPDGIDL